MVNQPMGIMGAYPSLTKALQPRPVDQRMLPLTPPGQGIQPLPPQSQFNFPRLPQGMPLDQNSVAPQGMTPQNWFSQQQPGQMIPDMAQNFQPANMAQMPPNPPMPQRMGINAGRERQSPGIYKDPRTGALYGTQGQLIRAGSRRMR